MTGSGEGNEGRASAGAAAGTSRSLAVAAARTAPWLRAALRWSALFALGAALLSTTYAAQGLHTGVRAADIALGLVIVLAGLLAVYVAIRVTAALLSRGLRLVSRRVPGRAGRLVSSPLPALRLAATPLAAATLGLALMLWVSPPAGILGLYHTLWYFEIPIVGAALIGILAGIAIHAWQGSAATAALPPARPGVVRRPPLAAILAGLPAVALTAGLFAWCALPGTGDPLVHESPDAVARIPQLTLPDPSLPGPYRVLAATYGSGRDLHRPEYGANVTWRTSTVDVSAALPARPFPSSAYADWYWGFDASQLPIAGLAWYPADAPGSLPVVLIVHGNHDAQDYSDPGYAYLGEHLASHGMIAVSVDENYLNGDWFYDYGGAEMGVRAWLLLRHLDQLATWNGEAGHPLAGRVDLGRVALIGHSRGGEAAAVAAMYAQQQLAPSGLAPAGSGATIKAVVAFAPSDTMYAGPGAPAVLRDVDYLAIQGAHDGDLAGFDALRTYHRVSLSPGTDHVKVALYSERANHGRFNSVWDYGDAGGLESWMLDRGSMLSMADQQRLAKTAVGAFLQRSLYRQTGYDAFFREPRAGRGWLPDDVVESQWETSERSVVSTLDWRPESGQGMTLDGFTAVSWEDPMLRDGLQQGDGAGVLEWNGPARFDLEVAKGTAASLGPGDRLVFAMAARDGGATPNPLVEIVLRDGRSASIRLGDLQPPRPSLPTRLWKLPWLGDRYLAQEKHAWPAERFLQTYEVPLGRLAAAVPGFDPGEIASVGFRFDGRGSIYFDDVAFEKDPARQ